MNLSIFFFQVEFAGDNFVRISGDTVSHAKSQMFSWEAGAKGLDVHALAEPTKLEALKKEYEAKKTDFKGDAKQGRKKLFCCAFSESISYSEGTKLKTQNTYNVAYFLKVLRIIL